MEPRTEIESPRPLHQRVLNTLAAARPRFVGWRIADAVRRNVPRQLNELRIPGAQFAWAVAGSAVETWEFGLAAAGKAMRPDTTIRVASLSKPIAAMVLLRLVEQGAFSLDESVGDILAEALPHLPAAHRAGVTPRLLLCHGAGFAVRHAAHLPVGKSATLEDVIRGRFGEEFVPQPESKPATQTAYAGSNYIILQYAIERRLARSFATLSDELVLKPLQLSSTTFEPFERNTLLADEHDASGRPLPHQWTPCLASSGLATTARDLVRFGVALLDCARGRSHFLSSGLSRQMLKRQPDALPESRFSLGFHIASLQPLGLSHGSVRPGARGVLRLYPASGIAFAGILNGERGDEVLRPLQGLVGDLATRARARYP